MANRDTTGTGGTGGLNPAGSSVDEIKSAVSRAADEAVGVGRDTMEEAQGRIRSLLEQQTGRAADQLGGVASALHKAAEQLNAENGGVVADYAVQAAERVERAADLLRDATLDDIVGEVEGFARRQPEVFIGAAFAVGFLAARFLKSSGERRLHRAATATRSQQARSPFRSTARQPGKVDTGRFHTGAHGGAQDGDTGRTPSRGMAGGIGESAARSSNVLKGDALKGDTLKNDNSPKPGEPRPARIGMPLAAAPASSVSGAPVAGLSSSASSAALGAGANPASGQGASGTTSTTTKPQG